MINASLYGVIEEARASGKIGCVYGAIGGSEAILKERFLDLMKYPREKLRLLLATPSTAIGSSRYALEADDYKAMVGIFQKHQIKYVLFNGGNGTMDTCGKVYEACKGAGIFVVGIPKTIDNDIAITDHTPGFASAARYMAETTAEVGMDVKGLPIHVCVMEAMGRNAGWITAASALARKKPGDAPHLIYLPERPFHEEEFLEDVKKLYEEKGGVVVVVSEGLKDEEGKTIVQPIYQRQVRLLRGRQRLFGQFGYPEAGGQGKERKTWHMRKGVRSPPVPGGPGRGRAGRPGGFKGRYGRPKRRDGWVYPGRGGG